MTYITKPLTSREISKTILIGVVKGLFYYIVYYVILFGLIVYYVIPYLMGASGLKDFNMNSIISFKLIDINILAIFMTLSIIGTFLVRHIPYGRAMNTLLGLLMLYIVLLMFNFGEFSGYIEQYNIYYNVDLSPLFKVFLLIIAVFTIGQISIEVGREYKSRKTNIDTKNIE
ncbi:hypothetical protein Smar_1190 [Staphylothermus marinus F1]|uniref:Uncharacterized protein n=1 Tax=Staphylothermus marinus (strain ATCC 43588 / DSM 3639 / JCM 9404 / F1) TaxID=399550 RepID=A3DNS5_STAMF|nr:hypothetical protein [Staphylothermus marinus]ABN70285.1 hypothetical protein Smar_1190 [Staphylothermus marinus F1]